MSYAEVMVNSLAERRIQQRMGVTLKQINILHVIEHQPMPVLDVAEAIERSAGITSIAIQKLEERGLLVKTPKRTEGGRRYLEVSITDAGRSILTEGWPKYQRWLEARAHSPRHRK